MRYTSWMKFICNAETTLKPRWYVQCLYEGCYRNSALKIRRYRMERKVLKNKSLLEAIFLTIKEVWIIYHLTIQDVIYQDYAIQYFTTPSTGIVEMNIWEIWDVCDMPQILDHLECQGLYLPLSFSEPPLL